MNYIRLLTRLLICSLLVLSSLLRPGWFGQNVEVRAENSGLGSPAITADTAMVGQGTTFRFNYDQVADVHSQALLWALIVVGPSDQSYNFSSMRSSEQGIGTIASLPTSFDWSGSGDDGRVFPAGDYQATIEMTVMTTIGIQFTYANLPLQIVPKVVPTPVPTPTSVPTLTPTPIPTVTPTITPTPLPTPNPISKLHPVLLIHGLTGYPDYWGNPAYAGDYFALLKSWGYPDAYVSAYHYSGTGVGRDGYNNQGDIPEMAAGMHDALAQLHQISLDNGGDGLVDIICHSMGGLITRQYLKDHPNDNYLSKVVSIGTPYQGSWLMEADKGQSPAFNFVLNLMLHASGIGANVDLTAEQEMIPDSAVIKSLDALPYEPNIDYYSLVGENDVQFSQPLFDFILSSNVYDVGDVVVLDGSASLVSHRQPSAVAVYKDSVHKLSVSLKQVGLFSFSIDASSFNVNDWGYFHNNLTKQSDLQDKIKEILLYD